MFYFLMVDFTFFSVPSPCGVRKVFLASWHNIYSTYPRWLLGQEKQSYSDNDNLLGLLRLAEEGIGCLFWTDLALSVGSGIRVGDCVGPEEGIAEAVEF